MKKLIPVGIIAVLIAMLALVGLAGSANATPDADNKKVEFCHATGSESNPYEKIETSVMAFYNAGHIDHEGDIWEAFSYTNNRGDVVNVPAQGDTSLLAFEDCEAPVVKEKVARPEPVFLDPCGTENDVFSVAPGRGYNVAAVTTDGVKQTITVTLAENFTWTDGGTEPLNFERPVFTNVDCDVPNTGVGEQTATMAGYAAVGGIVVALTVGAVRTRRQNAGS